MSMLMSPPSIAGLAMLTDSLSLLNVSSADDAAVEHEGCWLDRVRATCDRCFDAGAYLSLCVYVSTCVQWRQHIALTLLAQDAFRAQDRWQVGVMMASHSGPCVFAYGVPPITVLASSVVAGTQLKSPPTISPFFICLLTRRARRKAPRAFALSGT